ncbi:YlzJ-like family protein [Halonatronum saccharophilum]|uniref:YlzJ-like family protein n=1 Tax=Halonatronum saccharophilum TaxID=150060 RepID=UPI0004B059A0|nr:YlzJ-like family protein [Halonatronum saccharophilum]
MYYSILADGLWLEEDYQDEETFEIENNGVTLELKSDSTNSCEVVRIISSNPQDYLNSDYQPGTKVEFKPFISE